MTQFTHLHVHSHFSILDGMSKIPDLIKKCKKNGMYAMALTDHGNMFGIKELVDCVGKENGKVKDAIKEQQKVIDKEDATAEEKAAAEAEIARLQGTLFKPIIGTEAYCAHQDRRTKDGRGWHLILLAKNKQGYRSLCKLASYAYTEGYHYTSRIDHALLEQYHEGLICCSACLGGEVPQKIMKGDLEGAERAVLWFKSIFGDDYYLELQRHETDKPNASYDTFAQQQEVNAVLIELARKHNIKIVATNDVHFVEEEHGEAHDRLICLSTGKDFDDPTRMHYSKQEWLKSPEEMAAIFSDVPEALENTMEIAAKVEAYSIDSDPIMPVFPIPDSFGSEEEYRQRITEQELFDEFTRNEKGEVVMSQEAAEKKIKKLGGYNKLYRIKFEADYLEKLVWEGAHYRYGETLSDEQTERIVFELHTIKTMGFPGYFLIVSDYIRGAREEVGGSGGPGRGAAAGSVVAYCLKITDVDPLKYDLLFERFLNPDRISLPDIDVDFDDDGRGRVLDWVTNKYGKEKVAHIITYGTMATKSSLADVGRVQKMPLSKVAELKSYIPEKSFADNIKDEKGKSPKVNLTNCYKYIPELKAIMEGNDEGTKEVMTYAEMLEDTNRQIGIHACGFIIGAEDLSNIAPICVIKDKDTGEDVPVTQYDGHVVETVGLIKMDFLGLKTLTIIKDAIRNVKKSCGDEIDIDHIPIDDELTYKLYCDGATVGTFQFESPGMQKYLRELQPHVFEDLIAMNALYRPGPMDYIPTFIKRKLGQEPIQYPIPEMEKYLKDTYGVTVYQEQVMLLSRQLASFTRGESDTLRKAMGKKQIAKMMELQGKFMEQGQKNGHDPKILEGIWADWEKFASYAFNKSHATCYSWVAYQTAYLKAHYPAEYMSAVLTSVLTDNAKVTFYMEECRRMKIPVLRPDVNESDMQFAVNDKGEIRFGLAAIKGMGEAASSAIIAEREANGPFADIFDLLERVDLRSLNRKCLEVMAQAGAFDCFPGVHRAQYLAEDASGASFCERALRWAARKREGANSNQISIFDVCEEIQEEQHPDVPECEAWLNVEQCNFEKEVIGFYLSGHPLDDYRWELKSCSNHNVTELEDLPKLLGKGDLRFGGVITKVAKGVSKKGSPYGSLTVEDYVGSYEFRFFGNDYVHYANFLNDECKGWFIFIKGDVQSNSFRNKEGEMVVMPPKFVVRELSMLDGVLDRSVKNLSFHVRLDDVTPEFCDAVAHAAKESVKARKAVEKGFKATVPVACNVLDEAHHITLFMKTRDLKVSPKEFLPLLEAIPGVYDIKINGK